MSEYSFVKPEVIDRLNEVLARYAEDAREKELQETYDAGYQDGLDEAGLFWECDCEYNQECYNPDHVENKVNVEALADAICERPI